MGGKKGRKGKKDASRTSSSNGAFYGGRFITASQMSSVSQSGGVVGGTYISAFDLQMIRAKGCL